MTAKSTPARTDTVAMATVDPGRSRSRVDLARQLSMVGVLIVLVIIAQVASPGFLEPRNLAVVLANAAPVGIVAVGMTFVLIAGGFDLSVGGIFAAAGMLFATFANVLPIGLALLATMRGGLIGCDIEWRNPDLACPRVAERLFASEEYEALTALPSEQWTAGFFNCWTRKEAYVKALGLGLSYPLDAFTVSVEPNAPARFTSDERGWTLASFEPAPGYQAALVTWAGPSPAR